MQKIRALQHCLFCIIFGSCYRKNYEKHAPRVSQVIAAVAKVSCKHGLWLVAREKKCPEFLFLNSGHQKYFHANKLYFIFFHPDFNCWSRSCTESAAVWYRSGSRTIPPVGNHTLPWRSPYFVFTGIFYSYSHNLSILFSDNTLSG